MNLFNFYLIKFIKKNLLLSNSFTPFVGRAGKVFSLFFKLVSFLSEFFSIKKLAIFINKQIILKNTVG